LLELGWEAFVYIGQCIHVWAYDMQKAMPIPLTDSERRAFEGLYFCQPEFGNIPLVLLAEKLQFVDTVLDDIVNSPGKKAPIQVLYKLLHFYSVMVYKRREADVRIKESRKSTRKWLNKETGQTYNVADRSGQLQDADDLDSRVEDKDILNTIYKQVAKIKNLNCKCPQPEWDVTPEQTDNSQEFQLEFRCKKCDMKKCLTLPLDELKKIQSELR
jgi:hypothetical protein